MPQIHPHALKGAITSLAVMWRLPVLLARDPEDSLTILRFLANQLCRSNGGLKRYDRKPKRLASRKLYVLQGLSEWVQRWRNACCSNSGPLNVS
jgi:ERCC4-type nuclease